MFEEVVGGNLRFGVASRARQSTMGMSPGIGQSPYHGGRLIRLSGTLWRAPPRVERLVRKGVLTPLRSSSDQQLGAPLARSLEYLAYSDCRLGMVHRFRHFSLRGILGSAADCICLWALHLQVSYGSLDPRLFVRVQLIVFFRSTPDACAL